MNQLEAFLRAEIEPLQYAAFFGALAVFGLLELIVARSAASARRSRRWPLNTGLTFLNIVVMSALPVSGVIAADYARSEGIGLLNAFAVAPVLGLAIGILWRSFVSWGVHLAMHKVPFLWRVHRVHHTDTHLDVSTTVRFHPIEFLINAPILIVAVLFMGISPVALMLYEILDAAMAVFTHANVRLPRLLERVLKIVLVTPDMHRVHHSSLQPETDSNYGATLSIWDRLFGTYRDKPVHELASMELGLEEAQDDRSNSALWLLTLPFRGLVIPLANQTRQTPVKCKQNQLKAT